MASRDGNNRRVTVLHFFLAALFLLLGFSSAGAAQLTLAWDANSEADLAGYRIYYGNASRTYSKSFDVGKATTCLISDIDPSLTYYFTATAYDIYGNESVYSSEVVMDSNDSDQDGLSNSLELSRGTNPYDADSDDDGIPDGVEDADGDGSVDAGETDPRLSDSDGDGLQDGTELGYTLADVGSGTDLSFFSPDLDPSTATDPLDPDTDGDGLIDGVEDANRNGRLDAGETDPNPSSVPLSFSDDFSDGGSDGDPEWLKVSGKWRVDRLKQYSSSLDANCRTVVADPAFRYFNTGRIESRVKLTSKYRKYPNAAVIFAMADRTHYRWVRLTEDGVSIGQTGDFPVEVGGRKTTVQVPMKSGQWYHVRVDVAVDGSVKVYLGMNPELAAEYSFTEVTAGAVGFQTRGAKSIFDDFVIREEKALP